MKPKAQDEYSKWLEPVLDRYRARTPVSARLHGEAAEHLPGGNTRSVMHFDPYPVHLVQGEGCRLKDADGHTYLDFINNYTSLIHGNAHPGITEAAGKQMALGVCFPGPHRTQAGLAEMICDRIASVEQVRFCNSGTEATLHAIRAARVYTGKTKIIKVEGGYHGTHDSAEVSVHPDPLAAGPAEAPLSLPENAGISPNTCQDVVIIPFNDPATAERIVTEQAGSAACLIVEPMMGAAGLIPPAQGYLELLRDLTQRHGLLLIFDEVITFRLGLGGLQGVHGLSPDLTAMGKIIGGGFPVGAFGGSREVMKSYSPGVTPGVAHSGTFNGNPVTMAAGMAALKAYTQPEIDRLNSLGDLMRAGLGQAMVRQGIKGRVSGLGSLFQPHFTGKPVTDYRSAQRANARVMDLVHLELLERGIYIAPRGLCALSTPMSAKEVDGFVSAFEEALAAVRPCIEALAPELLV